MATTSTSAYQRQLVEHLRAQGVSERTLQAFLTVPRHPFIPYYYIHQPGTRDWTRCEHEVSDAWYKQIYQDQALVIQIDAYGRTLSSSSQPGIMAVMLDALQVQPGMRVLEIGTGSGYNAALLAALTGDPGLVTSIDIDEHLVEQARQTVTQVIGEGMMIVQADGTLGYHSNAPYDRIVVTASVPEIPRAWVEQLAPKGILVCILQPPYAPCGGVLQACKQGDILRGKLIEMASFMVLRGETYPKRVIPVDLHAQCLTSFPYDTALFSPQLLWEAPHFLFFCLYQIADLHLFNLLKPEEFLVVSRESCPEGYLAFRLSSPALLEFRGEQRWARSLWTRLLQTYSFWLHCGEPSITDYQFEMSIESSEQPLFLATPRGFIWPFAKLS